MFGVDGYGGKGGDAQSEDGTCTAAEGSVGASRAREQGSAAERGTMRAHPLSAEHHKQPGSTPAAPPLSRLSRLRRLRSKRRAPGEGPSAVDPPSPPFPRTAPDAVRALSSEERSQLLQNARDVAGRARRSKTHGDAGTGGGAGPSGTPVLASAPQGALRALDAFVPPLTSSSDSDSDSDDGGDGGSGVAGSGLGLGSSAPDREPAQPPLVAEPRDDDYADAGPGGRLEPGGGGSDAEGGAEGGVRCSADDGWLYLNDAGNVEGPFSTAQMRHWMRKGYLPGSLPTCWLPHGREPHGPPPPAARPVPWSASPRHSPRPLPFCPLYVLCPNPRRAFVLDRTDCATSPAGTPAAALACHDGAVAAAYAGTVSAALPAGRREDPHPPPHAEHCPLAAPAAGPERSAHCPTAPATATTAHPPSSGRVSAAPAAAVVTSLALPTPGPVPTLVSPSPARDPPPPLPRASAVRGVRGTPHPTPWARTGRGPRPQRPSSPARPAAPSDAVAHAVAVASAASDEAASAAGTPAQRPFVQHPPPTAATTAATAAAVPTPPSRPMRVLQRRVAAAGGAEAPPAGDEEERTPSGASGGRSRPAAAPGPTLAPAPPPPVSTHSPSSSSGTTSTAAEARPRPRAATPPPTRRPPPPPGGGTPLRRQIRPLGHAVDSGGHSDGGRARADAEGSVSARGGDRGGVGSEEGRGEGKAPQATRGDAGVEPTPAPARGGGDNGPGSPERDSPGQAATSTPASCLPAPAPAPAAAAAHTVPQGAHGSPRGDGAPSPGTTFADVRAGRIAMVEEFATDMAAMTGAPRPAVSPAGARCGRLSRRARVPAPPPPPGGDAETVPTCSAPGPTGEAARHLGPQWRDVPLPSAEGTHARRAVLQGLAQAYATLLRPLRKGLTLWCAEVGWSPIESAAWRRPVQAPDACRTLLHVSSSLLSATVASEAAGRGEHTPASTDDEAETARAIRQVRSEMRTVQRALARAPWRTGAEGAAAAGSSDESSDGEPSGEAGSDEEEDVGEDGDEEEMGPSVPCSAIRALQRLLAAKQAEGSSDEEDVAQSKPKHALVSTFRRLGWGREVVAMRGCPLSLRLTGPRPARSSPPQGLLCASGNLLSRSRRQRGDTGARSAADSGCNRAYPAAEQEQGRKSRREGPASGYCAPHSTAPPACGACALGGAVLDPRQRARPAALALPAGDAQRAPAGRHICVACSACVGGAAEVECRGPGRCRRGGGSRSSVSIACSEHGPRPGGAGIHADVVGAGGGDKDPGAVALARRSAFSQQARCRRATVSGSHRPAPRVGR